MTNNIGWQARSRCNDMSPSEADRLFFGNRRHFMEAVAYCKECPVRSQCLHDASMNPMKGFIAGTSEYTREMYRAQIEGELRRDSFIASVAEYLRPLP